VKINSWKIYGTLTRPMTGRTTEQYIEETYNEIHNTAEMLVSTAWNTGISARSTENGYFAVHRKSADPPRFIIEDASLAGIIGESNTAARPIRVAVRTPVRYPNPISTVAVSSKNVRPQKEKVMATTRTAPTRKSKAPQVEEPEEVEDEEEDEELEDELDEEDEDEEDEEEDDEEDEEDEDDEDDGDDEEEDDEEEDEAGEQPDYTPYASKPITVTMQDFAEWMNFAIFEPVGSSIEEVGAEDPVRLIAIAGTARMEFQRSDFNKSRRAERQTDREKTKAKPAAKAKAVPAKAAAKAVPAKAAAKAVPAKAAAKAVPAKSTTGGRVKTRRKGAAPY
jgi:hypothetical protein